MDVKVAFNKRPHVSPAIENSKFFFPDNVTAAITPQINNSADLASTFLIWGNRIEFDGKTELIVVKW